MSYKIKNTGGVLNIGQLMDFDGETVDIATNKSAIQAVWKDADGNAKGGIVIAENAGDNYDCLLNIRPSLVTVTGTLDPDITGSYTVGGIYNGKNYYQNANASRFIWWEIDDETEYWNISPILGSFGSTDWYREDASVAGEFTPDGMATGTATVAVIADNESLPLGTHTIRLSSTTDAIIPRNIVIDVVSEAAYQQYSSGIIIGPSTSGLFNL